MDWLISRFKEVFNGDTSALRRARAPGRVNLIGGHTDYNGGFVLPMAIDRHVSIVFRPLSCNQNVRVWSENFGEMDDFDPSSPEPIKGGKWENYVRGTAWAMKEGGMPVRPFEGVLYGDVPVGAGLSSSAALEVASAMALYAGEGIEGVDKKQLALVCQRAENRFAGVACGIMDQFVSLHARQEHAVLIDCSSLECELLPLDTGQLTVVVANTMAEHQLAGSAYNERRSTCERAAAKIGEKMDGVSRLRDVSAATLRECKDFLTPTELRRARHVVTENQRVRRAASALRKRDWNEFGEMLIESHRSLRDDYEVSCRELDTMVDIALECEGTYGARMTGAGFGGCTVNLVDARMSAELAELLTARYTRETGIEPEIFRFNAAGGANLTPFS